MSSCCSVSSYSRRWNNSNSCKYRFAVSWRFRYRFRFYGLCVQKGHIMDQSVDSGWKQSKKLEKKPDIWTSLKWKWCKWLPVVEHGEELDNNRCCKTQNEHEGNGINCYEFSGVVEVEVDLGDPDGEVGLEELEGKCRHKPHGIQHEEGKVYLCVMRRIRLIQDWLHCTVISCYICTVFQLPTPTLFLSSRRSLAIFFCLSLSSAKGSRYFFTSSLQNSSSSCRETQKSLSVNYSGMFRHST